MKRTMTFTYQQSVEISDEELFEVLAWGDVDSATKNEIDALTECYGTEMPQEICEYVKTRMKQLADAN